MKKILITISAWSLACTSCSVDLSGQGTSTVIDSIVNERVRLLKLQHRHDNDSIIRMLAAQRAATIFPPNSVVPKRDEIVK